MASNPCDLNYPAVALLKSTLISLITIFAPAWAKTVAIALPMPLPEPVTIATISFNESDFSIAFGVDNTLDVLIITPMIYARVNCFMAALPKTTFFTLACLINSHYARVYISYFVT